MNNKKIEFADNYSAYALTPKRYLSIEGIPSDLTSRLPGFVDFGINGDQLVETIRAVGKSPPGTTTWSLTMINQGDIISRQAEYFETQKNNTAAYQAYIEASFWYFFARFPHVLNQESQEAYQRHNESYLKALKYSPYLTERIELKAQEKVGSAILRMPTQVSGKIPLVIVCGGVDVWKSDLELHYLSEKYLKQGVATLQIDGPGTGECPLPASNSAHGWFSLALDLLKKDTRINPTAIGMVGLSFGGYWATKMAFIYPELKGCINIGGPLHYTFENDSLKSLPLGLKKALSKMSAMNMQDDFAQLHESFIHFSLLSQGLINKSHAPILYINGSEDNIVSIKEFQLLQNYKVNHDSLIFGGDRHVASGNTHLRDAFATQWLGKKLN